MCSRAFESNGFILQPKRGFGTHGHANMEIVTLVVGPGKISHADSFSRQSESLGRGSVQFMSAGSGVSHSEQNLGDLPVRFIQCWVLPRSQNEKPVYGSLKDSPERLAARHNAFDHLVGDRKSEQDHAPVKINADCNFWLAEVDAEHSVRSSKKKGLKLSYICGGF